MIEAIVLMLVLGSVLGLGLGVADKLLKVEVDERIDTVTTMLPGYNCGGCGFPGCSGMATALIEGTVNQVGRCKPCKPEQKQAIVEYINTTPGPNGEVLTVVI